MSVYSHSFAGATKSLNVFGTSRFVSFQHALMFYIIFMMVARNSMFHERRECIGKRPQAIELLLVCVRYLLYLSFLKCAAGFPENCGS